MEKYLDRFRADLCPVHKGAYKIGEGFHKDM